MLFKCVGLNITVCIYKKLNRYLLMQTVKDQLVQKYLPIALDVILHKPNQHTAGLTHKQRALVSKIVSNIHCLCKLNKKEVVDFLKTFPSYQPVLGEFFFDQTLNNWRLITNDNRPAQTAIAVNLLKGEKQCVGVEYRIEFTLATMGQKKGVKAVVLMVFRLEDGSAFRVYFNLKEFQQFRYQIAQIIKSIHSVEMKALF